MNRPAPASGLAQELERRDEALVRAGFNLTQQVHLERCDPASPAVIRLVIPDAGPRQLSLWLDAGAGSAAVRLLGPEGRPLFNWSGQRLDATSSKSFPAGRYRVEIRCAAPSPIFALLGIQGSAVPACALETERTQEIPAAPEAGFHSPYLLFVPDQLRTKQLLVAPNNTGFETADLEVLRASASCQLQRHVILANRLGAPLLVPLFPRPAAPGGLYLHALSRAALLAREPAWQRVDLQLLAMVRDAREHLAARGLHASGKLLLTGFSAAGSFVDRFAMLHPAEVLAVSSGAPGGWPLAPQGSLDGAALPYPVGTGDLLALTGAPLDLPALRRVRWLFLLGSEDANDAVTHRDSFSEADEELIVRRFGKTPVARWKAAEALYAAEHLDARFALYPNVGHEESSAMQEDTARFFESCLAQEAAPEPRATAKPAHDATLTPPPGSSNAR